MADARYGIWMTTEPVGRASMLLNPRMRTRDRIRHWLGIEHIHEHLQRMENIMATALEQLTELQTAVSDMASDVNAKLDQLAAAQGEFTPEAQQVFDDIKQAVSDVDAKAGDADGSDTVPPEGE